MNKNEWEIFAGIKFQTIILKSGTGKINFERGKADEYTEKNLLQISFFATLSFMQKIAASILFLFHFGKQSRERKLERPPVVIIFRVRVFSTSDDLIFVYTIVTVRAGKHDSPVRFSLLKTNQYPGCSRQDLVSKILYSIIFLMKEQKFLNSIT